MHAGGGRDKGIERPHAPQTNRPTARTSSVVVRSYPPGAEVFVDGAAVGTTADDGKLKLSNLRLGAHRIVLKKDGYKEWVFDVILKAKAQVEEIALLQSENPQFMRDIAKLPAVEFGKEVTGRISRDSVAAGDGKTFYNEYVLKVDEPDAYLIVLRARGAAPSLKLVDDANVPYSIQRLSDEIYQSVIVGHPGYYYLQVVGQLDESSFATSDYSLKVLKESDAHGARTIAVGDTASGALEPTDRQSAPGDFYDAWSLTGQAGTQVRVAVQTSGAFTPGLTLFLDGQVVSMSGQAAGKKEKKKKGEDPASDAAYVVVTLTGGTYTVFVRSLAGPKTGPYQLSVSSRRLPARGVSRAIRREPTLSGSLKKPDVDGH